MKNLIHYVILAITLLVSTIVFSATPFKLEDRYAIEISIGNIGNGIDAAAYNKLRKVIGNAVANNVVDELIMYGYGKEGGFSGCIEVKPSIPLPNPAFGKIIKQLNNIHPTSDTFYSAQRIKNCLSFPTLSNKVVTIKVAKANGSIACDLSSGKSLTDMRKELGNIAVYSAKKEQTDNVLTEACGFQTNENNVYQIAVSDLDNAIALGFSIQNEISILQSSLTPLKRSDCVTQISAGSQYESCTTLEKDCNFVLDLRRYGNKSEAVRKNVRKVCGQQPTPAGVVPSPPWKKIWKDKDCNNLRPVWRTAIPTIPATTSSGAVTYTPAYKQYIWDTCHLVPPLTWGNRP